MKIFPYRARLEMRFTKESFVPFNYQHHLMGAIYTVLSETFPNIAQEFHSLNVPKPFTFSLLRGKPKSVEKNGIVYDNSTVVKLVISSWSDEFLDAFGIALLRNPFLSINGSRLEVVKYSTYTRKIGSQEKFVLLSPMVLSRPVEKGGKLYHEFLSPRDSEFAKRFSENLKKKFEMYVGKDHGEVEIEPDEEYVRGRRTSKLVDIKGTKIRAHVFPFTLRGDERLIEFGYYAGFGERTGQGFGCAEVLSDLNPK